MNWFLIALKKYATFTGRAQRAEYWYFVLFNLLISIAAAILDGLIGGFDSPDSMSLFSGLVSLGLLLPGIAVGVRRLHDTDRSGWWLLVCLIPLLGWIALLIFTTQDSQPGENQYGLNPKGN